MEREKATLSLGETPNVKAGLSVYAHTLKRRGMGDRRDQDFAVVREADEATIEEMVDGGCQ